MGKEKKNLRAQTRRSCRNCRFWRYNFYENAEPCPLDRRGGNETACKHHKFETFYVKYSG